MRTMTLWRAITAIGLSANLLPALAAPVVLETDGARVVVIRPVDRWRPDSGEQADTLASVQNRRCSFRVWQNGEQLRGSPTVFQSISDAPLTRGVEAEMKQRGMSLVSNDAYDFTVHPPAAMPPDVFSKLMTVQAMVYRQSVARGGDPATAQGRNQAGKFFGGAIAVLATVAAGGQMGMEAGTRFMLDTGLDADLMNLAVQERRAIVPSPAPTLDLTGVSEVEVRQVTTKFGSIGEVVIAYRGLRTPQSEEAALVMAIVSLTGADTTPAEVEQTRAEELADRQAIWDACVAAGRCQKSE